MALGEGGDDEADGGVGHVPLALQEEEVVAETGAAGPGQHGGRRPPPRRLPRAPVTGETGRRNGSAANGSRRSHPARHRVQPH